MKKIKSLITGFNLTKNKVYDVIFEYDSVYELQCDDGRYCRPKNFFVEVDEIAEE